MYCTCLLYDETDEEQSSQDEVAVLSVDGIRWADAGSLPRGSACSYDSVLGI